MTEMPIPNDRIAVVSGPECDKRVADHCPHSVTGRLDEQGGFVLVFADAGEAAAFRDRWLLDSGGGL